MNERTIRQWYDVMKYEIDPKTGEEKPFVFEVRILDGKKTYSGYFKDVETMLNALKPYDGMGIYSTLNAVKEECFSRTQSNRIIANPKETTSAQNIEHRNIIMVDFDPKRSSGICATDDEKRKAQMVANKVYAFLRDNGFERPCVADSGNGVHLYYRVALANTDENTQLVKTFLNVLNLLFGTEDVDVDCSTFDPNRIAKIVGTSSNKGSSTKERPHRESYWVKVEDEFKITPKEIIEKIAALMPVADPPSRSNHYAPLGSFNLEEFLQKYDIKVDKVTETSEYKKYVLDTCPFCGHHAPDSAIFEMTKSHGYGFVCFHNSCRHLTFKDFRLHFDPNAYDKATFADHVYRQNYYRVRPMFEPEPVTQDKGNPWKMMSEIKKTELSPNDYIPTGIKTLDDIVIGQKLGQVTVWSGRRGCAKSTLLNQVLLGSANRGARCALISRELSEGETKQWMMLQLAGKQYNQKSRFNDFYFTPNPIVERIEPWIDQYLRIYNNTYKGDILNLEDKIRQLYAEWPFQILALDNLMTIELDDLGERNEWDNQKKLLNKLTALARELKCHIHLVAHPNKQRQWLDCDSISGSGSIANYAQNVLIVHRIYPDTFESQAAGSLSKDKIADIQTSGCTNIVEIAKWRDKGSAMGKIIKLWFEVESNRLKSDPYEVITYNWQEQATQTSIDIIGDMPNYEIDGFPAKSNTDWLAPMDDNEVVPF